MWRHFTREEEEERCIQRKRSKSRFRRKKKGFRFVGCDPRNVLLTLYTWLAKEGLKGMRERDEELFLFPAFLWVPWNWLPSLLDSLLNSVRLDCVSKCFRLGVADDALHNRWNRHDMTGENFIHSSDFEKCWPRLFCSGINRGRLFFLLRSFIP